MATRQTPPPGPGWVYVDAQTQQAHPSWYPRGWHNTRTGQDLSRRQYDERYGRLRAQGFRSNEAQAAAHKSAGAPLRPARGRLKHTTLGDTDFFRAQATLLGYRQRLQTLLRYGYTGVRFIYGRPNEPHVSTNWFSLTAGNIPYILQQLLLDFQYDDSTPLYHFRDIILIGAVK